MIEDRKLRITNRGATGILLGAILPSLRRVLTGFIFRVAAIALATVALLYSAAHGQTNLNSIAPHGFFVVATGPRLILSWQDNSVSSNRSAGYIIERGTNSPASAIIITMSAGVQTNWVDTSPIPGVTNYYKIAAYNAAGTSSWSNVTGGLPH